MAPGKNPRRWKTHPVDRRVVSLWLLREICLFLSGGISSDKFDEDVLLGGTKSELIANDPTCYDIAYWFWTFYDDYKDQQWSELFDAGDEENRETVRIIGDILILLTSGFEFKGKNGGCLTALFSAFFRLLFFWAYWLRKRSGQRSPYPFRSISDRDAAREQFLLHRAEYVPKFIPQFVYDIYIAPFMEQASIQARSEDII